MNEALDVAQIEAGELEAGLCFHLPEKVLQALAMLHIRKTVFDETVFKEIGPFCKVAIFVKYSNQLWQPHKQTHLI